jgi:hypothetical protein
VFQALRVPRRHARYRICLKAAVAADRFRGVATWRRQAAELLPELWADEDDRETPYLFFFAVLPFVRDAHRRRDDDALRRGYAFARWCLQQGGDLGNAAGVSFYEHLFDSWDVHADVLRWLDATVVDECWPLWEARLDRNKLAVIRSHLRS